MLTTNPPISEGFLLNATMREVLRGLGKAFLLVLVLQKYLAVAVGFHKGIGICLLEKQ